MVHRKRVKKAEPERKAIQKRFFQRVIGKPFRFKTNDGKTIHILRNGIENLHPESKRASRPLVMTLVNGKIMYFYKSTGQNSQRPGDWLPAQTMRFGGTTLQPTIDTLVKMPGHPNRFPEWINQISSAIKTAEQNHELNLQSMDPEKTLTLLQLIGKKFKRVPESWIADEKTWDAHYGKHWRDIQKT